MFVKDSIQNKVDNSIGFTILDFYLIKSGPTSYLKSLAIHEI